MGIIKFSLVKCTVELLSQLLQEFEKQGLGSAEIMIECEGGCVIGNIDHLEVDSKNRIIYISDCD